MHHIEVKIPRMAPRFLVRKFEVSRDNRSKSFESRIVCDAGSTDVRGTGWSEIPTRRSVEAGRAAHFANFASRARVSVNSAKPFSKNNLAQKNQSLGVRILHGCVECQLLCVST